MVIVKLNPKLSSRNFENHLSRLDQPLIGKMRPTKNEQFSDKTMDGFYLMLKSSDQMPVQRPKGSRPALNWTTNYRNYIPRNSGTNPRERRRPNARIRLWLCQNVWSKIYILGETTQRPDQHSSIYPCKNWKLDQEMSELWSGTPTTKLSNLWHT